MLFYDHSCYWLFSDGISGQIVASVDSFTPPHLALRAALGSLPRADPSSGGAGNLEHWPRWDHTLFPNNRALITCVGWHGAF